MVINIVRRSSIDNAAGGTQRRELRSGLCESEAGRGKDL
jgi:hypothetical protein